MTNKFFIDDIRKLRKQLKRLTDIDLIYIIRDSDKEQIYQICEKIDNIFNDTKLKSVKMDNNITFMLRKNNMPIREYPLSYRDFYTWYMSCYIVNHNYISMRDIPKNERPKQYQIHRAYRVYLKYNRNEYNIQLLRGE